MFSIGSSGIKVTQLGPLEKDHCANAVNPKMPTWNGDVNTMVPRSEKSEMRKKFSEIPSGKLT